MLYLRRADFVFTARLSVCHSVISPINTNILDPKISGGAQSRAPFTKSLL